MLQVFAPVFALIAVGALLRRYGLLQVEDSYRLVNVIVYATFPATLFLGIIHARFPPGVWLIPLWAILAMSAVGLLLTAVARWMRLDRPSTGSFIIATTFGNTAFLGVPLCFAAFGEPGRTSAIIYDLAGASIPLYMLGFAILEAYGGQPFSWRAVFSFFRTPMFISAVAATLVRMLTPWWHAHAGGPWALSDIGLGTLERLAPMTAPLAMVALGVNLRLGALREFLPTVGIACIAKLVLIPFVVAALIHVAGSSGVAARTAVLEAGMPSGLVAGAVCGRYGCNARLGAAITMGTTIAAILTLPLITALLAR